MSQQHATDLRTLMDRREISAKALARAIETDPSTVSRWRSGVKPSPLFRGRIADFLGLGDAEVAALGWSKEPTSV